MLNRIRNFISDNFQLISQGEDYLELNVWQRHRYLDRVFALGPIELMYGNLAVAIRVNRSYGLAFGI